MTAAKLPDEPKRIEGSMNLYVPRADYDALLSAANAARERVAAIDDALDFEPDEQHTIADMANVGRSLMQAITDCAPKYCWNTSPAEIVHTLINERDEAEQRASAAESERDGIRKDASRYEDALIWYSDQPNGQRAKDALAGLAQKEAK